MNQFTKLIAAQLNLKEQAVENTLALLEEGLHHSVYLAIPQGENR